MVYSILKDAARSPFPLRGMNYPCFTWNRGGQRFIKKELTLFAMLLTYKTRIEPTPAHEQVLWDLAERCRLLYNFALQDRRVNWGYTTKSPTHPTEVSELCGPAKLTSHSEENVP